MENENNINERRSNMLRRSAVALNTERFMEQQGRDENVSILVASFKKKIFGCQSITSSVNGAIVLAKMSGEKQIVRDVDLNLFKQCWSDVSSHQVTSLQTTHNSQNTDNRKVFKGDIHIHPHKDEIHIVMHESL